jgi:hypothetical protein
MHSAHVLCRCGGKVNSPCRFALLLRRERNELAGLGFILRLGANWHQVTHDARSCDLAIDIMTPPLPPLLTIRLERLKVLYWAEFAFLAPWLN